MNGTTAVSSQALASILPYLLQDMLRYAINFTQVINYSINILILDNMFILNGIWPVRWRTFLNTLKHALQSLFVMLFKLKLTDFEHIAWLTAHICTHLCCFYTKAGLIFCKWILCLCLQPFLRWRLLLWDSTAIPGFIILCLCQECFPKGFTSW